MSGAIVDGSDGGNSPLGELISVAVDGGGNGGSDPSGVLGPKPEEDEGGCGVSHAGSGDGYHQSPSAPSGLPDGGEDGASDSSSILEISSRFGYLS